MKYLFVFLMFATTSAHSQSQNIARDYAPNVNQGVGLNPLADQFTRVDFDDDWIGDNNWKNLESFPLPKTVYYDIIEGEQHYFITYAFFYPRDYATVCFWVHCHENDLEGMKVVVNKKSGIVVRLETLAHNFKKVVHWPKEIAVVIEKEGHGIHPKGLRKPDPRTISYLSHEYELRPIMELWDKKNSSLFKGSFTFRGQRLPSGFKAGKWSIPIGGAKPPWSWDIRGSKHPQGTWFMDPAAGTSEKYISNPYLSNDKLPELAVIK